MGLFFKKKEKKVPSLNEIKDLTLGKDSLKQKNPLLSELEEIKSDAKLTESNFDSTNEYFSQPKESEELSGGVQRDLEEFRLEQKKSGEEDSKNNLFKKNFFLEEKTIEGKQIGFKERKEGFMEGEEKSSFEKLMELNSIEGELSENSYSKKDFANQSIIKLEKQTKMNQDEGRIESVLTPKPIILENTKENEGSESGTDSELKKIWGVRENNNFSENSLSEEFESEGIKKGEFESEEPKGVGFVSEENNKVEFEGEELERVGVVSEETKKSESRIGKWANKKVSEDMVGDSGETKKVESRIGKWANKKVSEKIVGGSGEVIKESSVWSASGGESASTTKVSASKENISMELDKNLLINREAKESAFSKSKKKIQKAQQEEINLNLHTPIDDVFELLEKYEKIDVGELSKFTKLTESKISEIIKSFEEDRVVEIFYPTSLTKKPVIILKNPVQSKITKLPEGRTLNEYNLVVDFVPVKVTIIQTQQDARPTYTIEIPLIGKYTQKFLSFIKDEVAENMPIELDEITDPRKSKKLKERFFDELSERLKKYFQNSPKEVIQMLSGVLLHEMYGLGDIELLMGDDLLEEVGINSAKTPITVYHKSYGWLKTNILPGSEEEINNYSSQIGRKVGREITMLNPILDAHLLSGDRVNATLSPISSEGNTITIRRFSRKPWTIVDFLGKAHTMSSEMAATLWLAMQYEMNVIIAGGTASGKTSALNSLLSLIPTYHRILSIEDVREIVLPTYLNWNWVPLITRSPNPEGLGEVTMLDLMISSLRMRPDRIIVGEIRRKKEAEVLMEAIETGHSIYSTIHANSGYQVLRRLAEPPFSIPLMQIELIDLIVVQYRDRKTNKRRTYEIAEVEQTSGGQGLQVNTIYKWVPRTDSWDKLNKPNKLITLLNVYTGLTEDDINKEISDRKLILEWMTNQNINDLDMIGFLMKLFYADYERVKKMAQNSTSIKEVNELMKQEENLVQQK